MQQRTQNTLHLLDKFPRRTAALNAVVTLFFGSVLGLVIALWVIHATGNLPKPWSYVLNFALVLVLKITIQWFWTLQVIPFVVRQTKIWVERKIGQPITGSIRQGNTDNGQVGGILTTLIATMAIATLLVSEDSITPEWLKEHRAVITTSAIVAAVTLTAESLSTRPLISALARNQHEYQETRARHTLNHQSRSWGGGQRNLEHKKGRRRR